MLGAHSSTYQRELCVNVMHHQLDSHHVVATPGDDYVCVHLRRRNVVVERWLHHVTVLLQNSIQVSSSLADVPF